MKAEKIIGIVILIVILILAGISIYSGILDLQATDEDIDKDSITITLDDDDDYIETSSNHAPELDSIDDITITEGDKLIVLAYADDEDGDAITYTFSNLDNSEVDKNKFEWQTLIGDEGEYKITVTASDGELSDTESFIVYVDEDDDDNDSDDDDSDDDDDNDNIDTNSCPSATVSDVTAFEGELVTLDVTATDLDSDSLTITYETPFDENGEWQTQAGDAGEYTIEIEVSDNECTGTISVDVTINPSIDLQITSATLQGFDNNRKEAVFEVDVTNNGLSDISGTINIDGDLYMAGTYYHDTQIAFSDLASGETKTIELEIDSEEIVALSDYNDVDITTVFRVDYNDDYLETDENNNDFTLTQTVEEDTLNIDLVIDEILVYKNSEDNTLEFWIDYTNNGNYDITEELDLQINLGINSINYNKTTKVKISDDLTAGDTDRYKYIVDISNINALNKFGFVELEVTIDPSNTIEETDDTNNTNSLSKLWILIEEVPGNWWDDIEIMKNPNFPF